MSLTAEPVQFEIGDVVQFVGGGRFPSDHVLKNGTALTGLVGVIRTKPGKSGEFGITFRDNVGEKFNVSLNTGDLQLHIHSDQDIVASNTCMHPNAVGEPDTPVSPCSPVTTHQRRRKASASATQRPTPILKAPPASRLGRQDERGPAEILPAGNGTGVASARTSGRPRRQQQMQVQLPVAKQSQEPHLQSQLQLPQVHKSLLQCESEPGTPEGRTDSDPPVASSQPHPYPPSFYCPVSRQCMHDPVVLTDGHTYERKYIEQWLAQKDTSPVTGAMVVQKTLFPNHALRAAIEQYFGQVLSDHRKAIREAASAGMEEHSEFSCNTALVRSVDAMMECTLLVNEDLSTEVMLKRIMDEAKSLVGAEVASVFLLDRSRKELFSTVNSTDSEIRIPLGSGVAGTVANTGIPLIIPDAYQDHRFNDEVDKNTGFKTCNLVCVPIKVKGQVVGVAQLVNKVAGGVTAGRQGSDLQFTVDDQKFFEVLAFQAGIAIAQQGAFVLGSHGTVELADQAPSCSTELASPKPSVEDVSRELSQKDKRHTPHVPGAPNSIQVLAKPTSMSPVMRLALTPLLEEAWSGWETNTLTFAELCHNRPLRTLALHLFDKHGLIEEFSLDPAKLLSFLDVIEAGYPDSNWYHNRAHAASVLHFMHCLLHHSDVASVAVAAAAESVESATRRRSFVILAGLLAAVVHDFEHEGVTNDFLIKSMHPRALTYNDRSPNEQHHVAAAFHLLLQPEYNFLSSLTQAEFKLLRRLVLDMVLGTDMNDNDALLSAFRAFPAGQGAGKESRVLANTVEEAFLVLKVALKCADLGHLALPWITHLRWVHRLEREFFEQGDLEKKMGHVTSAMMDREQPGVTQTQVGFFEFVVLPLFRAVGEALPGAATMVAAVESNYVHWRGETPPPL